MKLFTSKVSQILGISIVAVAFLLPSSAWAYEYSDSDGYIYNTDCPTGILNSTLSFRYYISSVDQSGANAIGCVSIYPVSSTTRATHLSLGYDEIRFFDGSNGTGSVIDSISPLLPWSSIPALNNVTRIISFTPENGTTTASGVPVDFSLQAYISPDDIGSYFSIAFTLHNIDQNVALLSAFSPNDIYFLDNFQATTSGYFSYASSTVIADGNYRINAKLRRTYLDLVVNPFASVNQNLSHQFVVGTSTFIGQISQTSYDQFNTALNGQSATSTTALATTCVPWSGSFDTLNCLSFLFIPDAGYLSDTIDNFQYRVSTHFPLGYITDLISIFSTTTESTLTVVDTNLPTALGFGSPHIALSLNGVLDSFLYATSSLYSGDNSSTSATTTLYDITSTYWRYLVYIGAGFYIFRRILGSHIIPRLFS